jgi:hypothetical protein
MSKLGTDTYLGGYPVYQELGTISGLPTKRERRVNRRTGVFPDRSGADKDHTSRSQSEFLIPAIPLGFRGPRRLKVDRISIQKADH